MDEKFKGFVLSSATDNVVGDIFLLYCILVASAEEIDGKLISQLSEDYLTKKLACPTLTLHRYLHQLYKTKWIKSEEKGFCVGNASLLGPRLYTTDLCVVSAQSIKAELRRSAITPVRKKTPIAIPKKSIKQIQKHAPGKRAVSRELVTYYIRCCKAYFADNTKLQVVDWTLGAVYFRRLYAFFEDVELAKQFILFVFKNWKQVRDKLKWQGDINMGLFGTKKIIKTLSSMQTTSAHKRHKENNEPEVRIPAVLQSGEDTGSAVGDGPDESSAT